MKKQLYITILALIIIFLMTFFCLIYINRTNIHDDGHIHSTITEEIVKEGKVIDHYPYRLINGEKNYFKFPIHYPMNFYMLTSIFSIYFGPNSLLYIGLILTMLTSLFLFILIRKFDHILALITIPLVFLFTARRFVMSPLIEPLVGLLVICVLYFMYCFVRTKNKSYILLSGIFLGSLMATKQQGLVYFFILFIATIIFFIFTFIRTKNKDELRSLLYLLLVFAIAILVSGPFLLEQQLRTGTLFYSPGEVIEVTKLFNNNSTNIIKDIFQSNIPISKDSITELDSIIAYRPQVNNNIFGSFKQFLLFPFISFRSGDISYQNSIGKDFLFISIILFIFSVIYLFKKDYFIATFVFSFIIIETILIYFLNEYLYQYYVFSTIALSIIFPGSLLIILQKFKNKRVRSFLFGLMTILILTFVLISFTNYTAPTIGNGVRYSNELLTGYEKTSSYIQKNIPEDAIIISSGNYADIYERNSLWLNEGGGSDIPKIFRTKNTSLAKDMMLKNNADYLLFDTSQTERTGVIDSIPKDGLVSLIGTSKDFKLSSKVNTGNYTIYLYQVIKK